MKLNKPNPSLDEQEKYNIAFSVTNLDKVKEFLDLTHQDYVVCNNLIDVIQKVSEKQVENIYLYSQEDYVLDDEPLGASALKFFNCICNFSGVVIFYIREF